MKKSFFIQWLIVFFSVVFVVLGSGILGADTLNKQDITWNENTRWGALLLLIGTYFVIADGYFFRKESIFLEMAVGRLIGFMSFFGGSAEPIDLEQVKKPPFFLLRLLLWFYLLSLGFVIGQLAR